ncbi:sorting nexin lst-4-like [Actinia tenebrosa]|uniref:Sorting nexin lst-4-like n=1 Tax=Actinia tenebrosa TaxID=6105 RepID=A0A6P8IE20_ACTTE|nr:sorting nexin lst-4-like [Actinia tenebrosa]
MLCPEERPYLSVNIIQSECFWAARNRSRTRTRSTGWSGTDDKQEEIKLRVRDPMTHIQNGKAVFTDYRIEIKAVGSSLALSYSSVRRRYNEFVWLHNQLRSKFTETKNMPCLPSKKLFGRFAVDFIESRQRALEDYLQRLLNDEVLLGNAHLHLFLQTNFTPSEIESTLSRKDHEDVNHIILLATANQHNEHVQGSRRHRSISDSALETSYSSLDISDVTPGTSEVFSSGYYGDDEVPANDQSGSTTECLVAQRMMDTEPLSSSSSEYDLSMEEFFEFDDKNDKTKSKRKSHRASKQKSSAAHNTQGLFEYLMPISGCELESYIVFGSKQREEVRPKRETNDERIKRLVNEYEVVSIL